MWECNGVCDVVDDQGLEKDWVLLLITKEGKGWFDLILETAGKQETGVV